MAVNFFILQSNGKLSGDCHDALHQILTQTLEECRQKLELGDLDVVVMNNPYNVIPRTGVNGMSYDAHQIGLTLDVDHPYLKEHFQSVVRALFAHELHHSARALARGSSHSDIYGGSLIAEGLACCFEEEMGEPTPFYAVECSGSSLRRFSRQAKKHAYTKRHELPGGFMQWMVGWHQNNRKFPYQCGYSTGYALVSHWLRSQGLTASEAVGVDERLILDQWVSGASDPIWATKKSKPLDDVRERLSVLLGR